MYMYIDGCVGCIAVHRRSFFHVVFVVLLSTSWSTNLRLLVSFLAHCVFLIVRKASAGLPLWWICRTAKLALYRACFALMFFPMCLFPRSLGSSSVAVFRVSADAFLCVPCFFRSVSLHLFGFRVVPGNLKVAKSSARSISSTNSKDDEQYKTRTTPMCKPPTLHVQILWTCVELFSMRFKHGLGIIVYWLYMLFILRTFEYLKHVQDLVSS